MQTSDTAMADAGIVHMFIHPGVLRGYHVYATTENWTPYQGENISFHCEHGNIHDQFAVAGRTQVLNRANVTVGHVPRELSRYIWYSIQHGAAISGKVLDPNPVRSPLVQGGLEILLELTIAWNDFRKLDILRKKMLSVVLSDYDDESREILRTMGVPDNEAEDDCAIINVEEESGDESDSEPPDDADAQSSGADDLESSDNSEDLEYPDDSEDSEDSEQSDGDANVTICKRPRFSFLEE